MMMNDRNLIAIIIMSVCIIGILAIVISNIFI